MSDAHSSYKPFARAYGVLIGITILWAGTLGLFLAGKALIGMLAGGDSESGG